MTAASRLSRDCFTARSGGSSTSRPQSGRRGLRPSRASAPNEDCCETRNRLHGVKNTDGGNAPRRIPLRSDQIASNPATAQAFDREAYRDRNAIERCVGWLKECRRIMTRFEKLAMNFLSFVHLAMIERLLRIGLSDSA
jgi:hypothetical protein